MNIQQQMESQTEAGRSGKGVGFFMSDLAPRNPLFDHLEARLPEFNLMTNRMMGDLVRQAMNTLSGVNYGNNR